MKILYIAPASSGHTKKFCDYFAAHGHQVHVISFVPGIIDSADVRIIDTGASVLGGDFQKLKYLKAISFIRQQVKQLKPDVINAHYLTSYGGIMALTGIKNYIVSVWGSDVYDFPCKSFLHKMWVKFSLSRAGVLFSTSKAMADEAGKYTRKQFFITPFGVDMNLFSPDKSTRAKNDGQFIVCCVKTLAPKYGIEYLIRAARLVKDKRPDINLKVRIAGKGIIEEQLKALTEELQLNGVVSFLGYISQEKAAEEWANADVSVIPSVIDSESFGVSAVEAQSCGSSVIISDIPGLMEATSPGHSSIVVPRRNPEAIAENIIKLYDDEELRHTLGRNGRKFVAEHYELNKNFQYIESLYREVMKKNQQ